MLLKPMRIWLRTATNARWPLISRGGSSRASVAGCQSRFATHLRRARPSASRAEISMSATDSSPPKLMFEWQDRHLHDYLQSGGAQGHLYDFGPINGEGYQAICLIKHVGR